MVYYKRVKVPREDLLKAVSKLEAWRGPRTGHRFASVTVYFPPHPKHMAEGLAEDWVLIIAHT